MQLAFFVHGVPVPKGSAKAFVNKQTGRAQVMQDNRDKQKPWSSMISYIASQHVKSIIDGPVFLTLDFVMPRPKSHYGTGKKSKDLKITAPQYHTSKPDLDKLIRCVKDALTGIVWGDDSHVCEVTATKRYGSMPGVYVTVRDSKEFEGEV